MTISKAAVVGIEGEVEHSFAHLPQRRSLIWGTWISDDFQGEGLTVTFSMWIIKKLLL
jgi:hypothetical protein